MPQRPFGMADLFDYGFLTTCIGEHVPFLSPDLTTFCLLRLRFPTMTNVPSAPLRVALGGDHAGFPLKQIVATWMQGNSGLPAGGSIQLHDCGAFDAERSDYPDFAALVAKEIVEGRADRGILVCGSGVGVSVAANKIVGIRAAVCHDTYTARQGVEHDDMNVLCIGGRVIGSELAIEVIRAFLAARYHPEPRHARRLEKLLKMERDGIE